MGVRRDCHFIRRTVCASLAADEYTPVYHPSLVISRAAGVIEIDGNLDDAGWRGAADKKVYDD